jgi:hypothetical protein
MQPITFLNVNFISELGAILIEEQYCSFYRLCLWALHIYLIYERFWSRYAIVNLMLLSRYYHADFYIFGSAQCLNPPDNLLDMRY